MLTAFPTPHFVCTAAVDWIIQYDPPDDPREYIHRVGRTARGKDGRGRALLLLMPEELGFLKYLKQAKVGGRVGFVGFVCMHEERGLLKCLKQANIGVGPWSIGSGGGGDELLLLVPEALGPLKYLWWA